ncbi:MAG: hypothetical protein ACFFDX_10020 [Candidatus Odinarchaeota archaeon]
MSKQVKGVIVSRLIILLAIILVPISIFFIYSFVNFDLWYSTDQILTFWIIKIVCPLVFSISWLFFLILFADRLANTMDSFDEIIGVVPSRLKFFYGINAVYILFIFVFPLITPIISVLSFASFAWRLTTFRKESWEDDTKISFLTKFMMGLFSLIPIFCTVSIIHKYLAIPLFLWDNIWLPLIDLNRPLNLFSISYSLFTALAIGSLIILFANSGISEYEQIFVDTTKQKKFWNVRILEIVLFGIFLYLDWFDYEIINFFYIAGFVIIIFISFVNFIRGKSKYKGFKSHLFGYLIAAVFIGSNVIFTSDAVLSFNLRIWSLVISAILYIFVLFYTFYQVE